jgi:hypothetical protein
LAILTDDITTPEELAIAGCYEYLCLFLIFSIAAETFTSGEPCFINCPV